ncbi:prolinerich transmembrane protein 2 [Striga asiatica]|uniref:Prolinerich transmembrane protein 2 n=1 Tax=Striga asiatica TaxID=4170 RepID=A0A5A7QNB8_STRAF|nr:prolinerich transmembrane protein 2 [Striga asiatica]
MVAGGVEEGGEGNEGGEGEEGEKPEAGGGTALLLDVRVQEDELGAVSHEITPMKRNPKDQISQTTGKKSNHHVGETRETIIARVYRCYRPCQPGIDEIIEFELLSSLHNDKLTTTVIFSWLDFLFSNETKLERERERNLEISSTAFTTSEELVSSTWPPNMISSRIVCT